MRVIMECCLQEKVFNKYYCVLASKLCSHDKNHKFTLQVKYISSMIGTVFVLYLFETLLQLFFNLQNFSMTSFPNKERFIIIKFLS